MSFSKQVKMNLAKGKGKPTRDKENGRPARGSLSGSTSSTSAASGRPSTLSQPPGTPDRNTSNLSVLADTAAFAAYGTVPSPARPLGLEDAGSASNLGRRTRGHDTEWTPRTKKRFVEFAADTFEEVGVPLERRDELSEAAQLTTHKLLIVAVSWMAKVDVESATNKTTTYVSSKDFKNNVAAKVSGMVMDPGMFSYKVGALERILRHIRLNMELYGIPPELRGSLAPLVFGPAVGKVLISKRHNIKKKLAMHWKDKSTIYEVTKDLCPRFMEPTAEMWGRVAWLQLQLVDHDELTAKAKSQASEDQSSTPPNASAASGDQVDGDGEAADAPPDYWTFIDNELVDVRELYAELPEDERKAAISDHFGAFLKIHIQKRPVGRKLKGCSRLPPWQRSIMKAVSQMAEYTQADLAEEEAEDQDLEPDDGDGDEAALNGEGSGDDDDEQFQ